MTEPSVEHLETLISQLRNDYEHSPLPLRLEIDKAIELAEDLIRAQRGDEGAAERIPDLRQRGARFLQEGTAGLERHQGAIWILGPTNIDAWRAEGAAGQVWVRWDTVPTKDRRAVASLASAWKDLVLGRTRAGRPKKNRPTK